MLLKRKNKLSNHYIIYHQKLPFRNEIMQNSLRQRWNLIHCATEHWRPPIFTKGLHWWQRLSAVIRRFFDLQAGSIWSDLAAELPKVSGTVLDVGCGAQPYRILLPPGVRYIGIDTVDAKAHFGYEMSDTIYFSGDTWPIKTESVDFILCAETLEHILDPGTFLSEMYRCLRPGGRILLTVPFAARWHFIPWDYWRFTPSGLNHLLERAGFVGIEVYARGNQLTVACYKQMALILPLLFSQASNPFLVWVFRLLGLIAMPILLVLAIIANLSRKMKGGNDCLGYTVLAKRHCGESAKIKIES